jgi:hypothetical protein
MGLYLCVFSSAAADDELEGVEVGSYEDFNSLRYAVSERLEAGNWGSRFPVLMLHSDSKGEWTPAEASALLQELQTIENEFRAFSPVPFADGSWQGQAAKLVGIAPTSLADSFIDVDGEPLLARLRGLASAAVRYECPISFQ